MRRRFFIYQERKGGNIKRLKILTLVIKYVHGGIIMNTSNITNYRPKDFAELLGVSVKTLQRWDREGTLKINRTPTDRRYYTYDQYLQFKGVNTENNNRQIALL